MKLTCHAHARGCDGETALARLAQRRGHGGANTPHGLDGIIEADLCRDAGKGHLGTGDGNHRTRGVAVHAGNLDEAGNRVAHETKQCLNRHGGGVRGRLGAPTEKLDHRRGGHRGRGARLGLASSLGTG